MSNLRAAFEQRRGELGRAADIAGGFYVIQGIIDLTGVGETTVDVRFPITFVEQPFLIGGGAVAPNQAIVAGEFPEWSVGVLRYDMRTIADFPDSPTFHGATLIVIVKGAAAAEDTFLSTACWMARGRALTNPTSGGV